MANPIIDRLLKKIGQDDLLEILTENLTSSDLNSLLLEVYRQKTQQISPAQLLQNYLSNRFVLPSEIPPINFLEFELDLLKFADLLGFKPIELSPLSPLGTCSVVASANQNKIVSALRGTEVTADATNLLALECVRQRKAQKFPPESLNFSTVHRHVRTQVFNFKGFSPHFKILGLVSAGRDKGNFEFERAYLLKHIQLYYRYFTEKLNIREVKVQLKFLNTEGRKNRLADSVFDFLQAKEPDLKLEKTDTLQINQAYYSQLQFKFIAKLNQENYEIADGGLVDWTQKLSGNQKERFLISGLGIELLFKLLYQLI